MSAKTARQLTDAYIDIIRKWVSCISPATVLAVRERPSGTFNIRTNPDPIRLRSKATFAFELRHSFAIIADPVHSSVTVRNAGYRYELTDAAGAEIFAYHFHPAGSSHIIHPHLHVGSHDPRLKHGKAHLPTGPVSLSDVVRCLITEFAVPPRRADWADILAASPNEDTDTSF